MEGESSSVDLGSFTNAKNYKQWNICFDDILKLKIDMVAIESVNAQTNEPVFRKYSDEDYQDWAAE